MNFELIFGNFPVIFLTSLNVLIKSIRADETDDEKLETQKAKNDDHKENGSFCSDNNCNVSTNKNFNNFYWIYGILLLVVALVIILFVFFQQKKYAQQMKRRNLRKLRSKYYSSSSFNDNSSTGSYRRAPVGFYIGGSSSDEDQFYGHSIDRNYSSCPSFFDLEQVKVHRCSVQNGENNVQENEEKSHENEIKNGIEETKDIQLKSAND